MRVIDALTDPVRTITVSPNGKYIAASTGALVGIWEWATGNVVRGPLLPMDSAVRQLAFTANEESLVFRLLGRLQRFDLQTGTYTAIVGEELRPASRPGQDILGGVAVSPDGKVLVATRVEMQDSLKLDRWALPAWRPSTGFDYWSPLTTLKFSANGEHLAGINSVVFELRFASSGGLNNRQQPRGRPRTEFFSFARHSDTVAFGWDGEFRVMETRNGNVVKRVDSPGAPFWDIAFLGSGQHLATIDGTSVLRVWSADSWTVTRTFDWEAGGLTCIAPSADGLAAVCGTDTGKLVVFDVDD